MRPVMKLGIGLVALLLALGSASALAQPFNSGSTGADGPFAPATSTTLPLPATGVFNFTTVNIPAGVSVTFSRNAANTPVTMLATGDVIIAGTINVNGAPGGAGAFGSSLGSNAGAGGPGGFHGGTGANGIVSITGGSGLGPGGGAGATADPSAGIWVGGGGGFAAPGGPGVGAAGGAAYGTPTLLPLIGGSGGGGAGSFLGTTGAGGGGGGGALLIASSGTITFTGTILARGGSGGAQVAPKAGPGGGGSGGAVRLVATAITGSGGTVNVSGGGGIFIGTTVGQGSVGRTRIEAIANTATINFAGVAPSLDQPAVAVLSNPPTLTITEVAGVPAPAAPTASFSSPDITLPATTVNPVTVNLASTNIPPGTTVTVTVKGQVGGSSSTGAVLSGTQQSSTASAGVTIPTNQPSVISASANFTLVVSAGQGPVFVQGEEVERVRVTATFGGLSQVAYITRSGREVVAPVR